MQTNGIILLFQIENNKAKQIQQICNSLQIRCKQVSPSDFNQTLGYLAGISGFKKGKAPLSEKTFPSEMLVFSGIPQPLLDQFLSRYKQALLSPIALKAIITIHNINWTPWQLVTELQKEHANFHP